MLVVELAQVRLVLELVEFVVEHAELVVRLVVELAQVRLVVELPLEFRRSR